MLPIADAEEALAVGREVLNTYNYLNLTNYVNNFKRLGFTDADLTPPGSDKFVDALIDHFKHEHLVHTTWSSFARNERRSWLPSSTQAT